jgi:hypothetical protein
MSLNKNQRAEARLKLKDSYIKRQLRKQKGLMAKDCTQEIIEEKRQIIISYRKNRAFNKKLIFDGKYKCKKCSKIKTSNMFHKDITKKYNHKTTCKKCCAIYDKIRSRSDSRKKAEKKYNTRILQNLEDVYIRRLLYAGTILKTKDIPQEMVEAKRQHLKLTRTIREES